MLRVRFAFTVTAFLVCLAVPAAANADPGFLERVSQGPSGGNGAVSVDQGRLSDDGRCVVFDTTEKLTSDDPNDRKDIYERCDSTTVLVSTGPAPNADTKPSPYLEYRGMSSDGGCVLFDTNGSNDGGTGDGGDQSAPPGAPEPFAGVAIVPGKVKVKHGIATVKITCPATAQSVCAGRLTLKGLGAKSFRIAPGKAAKVQVHLTRAGRKLLSAKRTVRTNAIAVSHDARGVSVTTKAKLKLVR